MAPPSEQIEILQLTTLRLTEAGFVYMLTGTLALAAYGESPAGRDIDLVVGMRIADAEWIAALFARDFHLDPAALERAASEAGVATLAHRATGVTVKCHALAADPYQRQAFDRRRTAAVNGLRVSVAAPEDLVLWFLRDAAREGRGALDAARCLLEGPGLDEPYLEEWAAHLGVRDGLRAARH